MRPFVEVKQPQSGDLIDSLPVQGNYLVVGPPGTGKTIQAIFRTECLAKHGHTRFLVYNNPLRQYVSQVVREHGIDAQTSTFYSWFWTWYRGKLGVVPPTFDDAFSIDWTTVWQSLSKFDNLLTFDALVIDEGQDFPREFYVLATSVAANVSVFADDCQRITDFGSTLSEIKGYLGIDSIYRLTKNYRNTRQIAEFVRTYYTGPETELPDLPNRDGLKPQVIAAISRQFGEKIQARFIAEYCIQHPDNSIGIFVPNWDLQAELVTRLRDLDVESIQSYNSDKQSAISLDFGENNVIVLRYGTAKGLEFDTVCIPFLDRAFERNDEATWMTFYVLTSRARSELYLLFAGEMVPPILDSAVHGLYDLSQIKD